MVIRKLVFMNALFIDRQCALSFTIYCQPGDIGSAVMTGRVEVLSFFPDACMIDGGHQQCFAVGDGLDPPFAVGTG